MLAKYSVWLLWLWKSRYFIFPNLYQTHQSWSQSKFWNLQTIIQIIMGKNSLVLGFWSLELYAEHTSHVGKAASSGSSVIQSIFTLNYKNSAYEEYRKKNHWYKVKQGFQYFILLQHLLSPSHFNSLEINGIDSIRNDKSYWFTIFFIFSRFELAFSINYFIFCPHILLSRFFNPSVAMWAAEGVVLCELERVWSLFGHFTWVLWQEHHSALGWDSGFWSCSWLLHVKIIQCIYLHMQNMCEYIHTNTYIFSFTLINALIQEQILFSCSVFQCFHAQECHSLAKKKPQNSDSQSSAVVMVFYELNKNTRPVCSK